jgi:serine/threonine protein kinase
MSRGVVPNGDDRGAQSEVGSPPDMAGTSVPPVPHCRDLTPVGERLASTLYAAHSDLLGHPVTVTLYPALADGDARRRFDRAAASAQRLAAHPSVLTIHQWGHGDDGRPWVITDPQPLETIDTLLRAGGPRRVEEALRIGVLVAGALETAHRAGIVHGDLSPARLVLGQDGDPLVADIGLAEFGDFPGFGALYNPIRYHAPPEALERTGVTAASDVYSLATTVYALLAGGAPHEKPADITDSNASLLLRILQIEVPPIVRPGEDIDGVEAALAPALAHAPGRRPPRVLDLARSLQGVQRNLGLAVVEPVVLDLGDPGTPAAAPAPAEEPPALPEHVPPVPSEADPLPAWYAASRPDPAPAGGTGLVPRFGNTPPDRPDRPHGASGPHWATGLGHLAHLPEAAGYSDRRGIGPPPDEPHPPAGPHTPGEPPPPPAATEVWAPTNGYRPNGHTREPLAELPPAGLGGRGNGLRQTPTTSVHDDPSGFQRPPGGADPPRDPRWPPTPAAPPWEGDPPLPAPQRRPRVDADSARTAEGWSVPPIVPRELAPGGQATRPQRSPGPTRRRPITGSEAPGSGAFPVAERTATGSALDRARQARLRRDASPGPAEQVPDQRAEGPKLKGPAAPSDGAPALPVIVLIVVVVLLTLGVAYMVITGDGTSDPVDDQPGASTPSSVLSVDEA